MNKTITVTFNLPQEFIDRVIKRCKEDKNIPADDIINDELDLLSNHCGHCGIESVYKEDVIGDAVIKAVHEAIDPVIYEDSDDN